MHPGSGAWDRGTHMQAVRPRGRLSFRAEFACLACPALCLRAAYAQALLAYTGFHVASCRAMSAWY
eukprot:1096669-Pelagomonas_calceolata.AAC.3